MRKLSLILVVLIAIGAVGYFNFLADDSASSGVTKMRAEALSDDDRVMLSDTLDDMKQKAKTYEENYETVAMARAANELAEDMLTSTDDLQKIQTAAGVFAGYMVRNTMGIKTYCASQGVDVSDFTEGFAAQHKKIAQKAEKYYVLENQLQAVFDEIKETLLDLVEQEMSDIAKAMGYKNNAQSCQFMNDNAGRVLKNAKFEKSVPSAYAVLSEAK